MRAAPLRTGDTAIVVGVTRPLMGERLPGSQMGSTRFGLALDELDGFGGARSVIRFGA